MNSRSRMPRLLRLSVGASLGLSLLLAQSSIAREGVDVGKTSAFTQWVSAEQVERSAQQQYLQLRQGFPGIEQL